MNIILDEIDNELEKCNREYEEIAAKKRELTAELDSQWRLCDERYKKLKEEREQVFLNLHPTLYVIHGHAEARGGTYGNYIDYDRIIACFTTKEAAEAVLGSRKHVNAIHHSITYSVKVEATVNIPKDVLNNLNRQPQYYLEWSP